MIMSKLHYGTSYFFNQPIVLGGEPERFDVVVCRYPDRGSTNLSSAWWVCRAIRFKFPADTCTSTA